MQRRDRGVAQSLGLPLTKRIKESRVLLIGAGGIGCELLKNLVCCGFGSGWQTPQTQKPATTTNDALAVPAAPARKAEIVVIDLDTIDLSNLNRQFLFRKQHIKKPKATVAKETASQFNPSVSIVAHFASIYDSQYDVNFFEGFDLVFNALDNLAARRHVNRMCLAADVPLIESGTTGFNGQVQAIRKGITECYDCNEKPVQKSFPICTIRSTPSQPIHCIVWAKSYLLPELFGASEDEESADVAVTEGDNAEEVAKLKVEAEALKNIRSLMGTADFSEIVFNKVFYEDVERLRSMSEMWTSRPPPTSLVWSKINIDKFPAEHGLELSKQDQGVWTLQDNMKVFCYSIGELSRRVKAGESAIEFDKDDKATLDFVAAAANLRSHIFGIPMQSEWDIKQMAGNIIPAIATSNALTASLCVMQAFKIVRSQVPKESRKPSATAQAVDGSDLVLGGSKMVFLTSKSTDRVISSEGLLPPRADCPVCSPVYAKLVIAEDGSTTLQELVDLLKLRLGYEDFSITADVGMIYDPDLDDNLGKPLKDLGIDGKSTGFLTITDDGDEPKVDLMLSVASRALEDGGKALLIPATIVLPPKPVKPVAENDIPAIQPAVEPADAAEGGASSGSKRKRDADDDIDAESGKKKAKAADEVLVIEDDGAILLD